MKYIIRENSTNKSLGRNEYLLIDEDNKRLYIFDKNNIEEVKSLKYKINGIKRKYKNRNYNWGNAYVIDPVLIYHFISKDEIDKKNYHINSINKRISDFPIKSIIKSDLDIRKIIELQKQEI